MSHKKLRPFIVKVSVLGYFPLHIITYIKTTKRVFNIIYIQDLFYKTLFYI